MGVDDNKRVLRNSRVPASPAGRSGAMAWFTTSGRHSRHGQWHGGQFIGFEAEPGAYSRGFAALYRFEGGQIAERWAVRDDLTMLRQLGAPRSDP